jgi:hypothetical protein
VPCGLLLRAQYSRKTQSTLAAFVIRCPALACAQDAVDHIDVGVALVSDLAAGFGALSFSVSHPSLRR